MSSAYARRLYLHLNNGGKITAEDMSRIVQSFETLEQRIVDLEGDNSRLSIASRTLPVAQDGRVYAGIQQDTRC